MNSLKELAEKLLDEWRDQRSQNIETDFWRNNSTSREEYIRNQVEMDTQYNDCKELIERLSNVGLPFCPTEDTISSFFAGKT